MEYVIDLFQFIAGIALFVATGVAIAKTVIYLNPDEENYED